MTKDHKQKLTFVLFCSGNGADSTIYRPSGDEKRYRHRQDALVRCVAATLFSAAGASKYGMCELILLYGDLSCMKMKLSSRTSTPPHLVNAPLEYNIVKSWKIAANEAARQQQQSSSIGRVHKSSNSELQTSCVLNSWQEEGSQAQHSSKISNTTASSKCLTKNKHVKLLPSHMPASKRDAISMLQSSCSLEFLRLHRLNTPLDVALKKFNKSKVQVVWDAAKNEEVNNGTDSGSGDTGDSGTQQSEHDKRIKGIFRNILAKAKVCDSSSHSTEVVASYLHESCDAELPCWSTNECSRNKEVKHIFLFCGAVRDMTEMEHESLSSICNEMKIPLLPCRLGPTPEFTSKIVSVAGHHFYKGTLGPGLIKLWEKKRKQTTLTSSQLPLDNSLSQQRLLHTIALIPMQSSLLSAEPNRRCRIHWCIVRLCVCSLYRSKLASTPSRKALDNNLTFVFQDKVLSLDQHGFISSMAEKHQAAPSERQILEELCRRRDDVLLQEGKDDVNELISSYTPNRGYKGDVYALDFTNEANESHLMTTSNQVTELAYSEDYCTLDNATPEDDSTLIAILQVRDQNGNTTNSIRHKKILETIARANIQLRKQAPLVSEAQDSEALTVIMLQHLDYQEKLFGILRYVFEGNNSATGSIEAPSTSVSGRKRKKKHKDIKKKKKKRKHK